MLRIYPVVLEWVRRLRPVLAVARGRSTALGDQFERALISDGVWRIDYVRLRVEAVRPD